MTGLGSVFVGVLQNVDPEARIRVEVIYLGGDLRKPWEGVKK